MPFTMVPVSFNLEVPPGQRGRGHVTACLTDTITDRDGATYPADPATLPLVGGQGGPYPLPANDDPPTWPQGTAWSFEVVLDGVVVSNDTRLVSSSQVGGVDFSELQMVAAPTSQLFVPGPPGPGSLTNAEVQTGPFTATTGWRWPVDTSDGPITVALTPAVPGAHLLVANVALSGSAPATLQPDGSDQFILPPAALPDTTAVPGESVEIVCLVASRWSLI